MIVNPSMTNIIKWMEYFTSMLWLQISPLYSQGTLSETVTFTRRRHSIAEVEI